MPPERQARLRAALEDVAAFYATRFGIDVPDYRLYVASDPEAAAAISEELTGRPLGVGHGGVAGTVTETAEGPLAILIDFPYDDFADRVLSHEYYHLFQNSAVPAERQAGTVVPTWIVEGTAEYASGTYIHHAYDVGVREDWVAHSLAEEAPFTSVASHFESSRPHYAIAALAVDWLVAQSGQPRSHAQYWELLGDGADWHAAFEIAFGITAADFHVSFEEYRTALLSRGTGIRGVIVDLEERALPGVVLLAHPDGPNELPLFATSASDGTFEIPVAAGRYAIFLARGDATDLAYDGTSGYVNTCRPATRFVIEDGDVLDLVIRVWPGLLGRVERPPCNEGVPGYRVITSVVSGPAGDAVAAFNRETYEGLQVKVIPFPYRVTGHRFDGYVESDGVARAVVADGEYILEIGELSGFNRESRRRLGWYRSGGLTTDRDEATVIEVVGADVGVIEIRLPAAPEELPTAPSW